MEENIITAIQHIRSKSKQGVTSERIFRFINKGAVSIECEFFQDCMNRLEIDGRIYQKTRGKNDGPNNVERVHKSPQWPVTIEKLESSADRDLKNIPNVTSSMHLINSPLLYRKDNSCGHRSDVCTDNSFF